MYLKFTLSLVLILLFILGGCSDSTPTGNQKPPDQEPSGEITYGDTILIIDRTGKIWDITHAVNKYGMDSAKFNFGDGPYSFLPYVNPQFYEPGQEGYPDVSESFAMMGTTIDGDSRAYPTSAMISREMINDKFGEKHIAVAF